MHLSTLISHEYSFIHGINNLQMTLLTFGSLAHKIGPQHQEHLLSQPITTATCCEPQCLRDSEYGKTHVL